MTWSWRAVMCCSRALFCCRYLPLTDATVSSDRACRTRIYTCLGCRLLVYTLSYACCSAPAPPPARIHTGPGFSLLVYIQVQGMRLRLLAYMFFLPYVQASILMSIISSPTTG